MVGRVTGDDIFVDGGMFLIWTRIVTEGELTIVFNLFCKSNDRGRSVGGCLEKCCVCERGPELLPGAGGKDTLLLLLWDRLWFHKYRIICQDMMLKRANTICLQSAGIDIPAPPIYSQAEAQLS